MSRTFRSAPHRLVFTAAISMLPSLVARAATITTNPYPGITCITRSETTPRPVNMHIALIDLNAPGISFAVTPHSGSRETTRQTTTDFVNQEQAKLGINVAFFDPVAVPASSNSEVYLAGLIMSQGQYVSNFDPQPAPGFTPDQSYAIVSNAPALNIDQTNHASVVHRDPAQPDNQHILESTNLWNAVSGSAQIITDGNVSIPDYKDATHPDGLLTPGGSANYSNSNSWYNLINARTSIGITQDASTLVLFTVDRAGGSQGMTVGEVANIMKSEYGCYQAFNLDGGGSTAMSLRDPTTGIVSEVNVSSDTNYVGGRPEGANFAVFAVPEPGSMLFGTLGVLVVARRRNRGHLKYKKGGRESGHARAG
jgi:exopolysaccharide biosynthesis protein